MERKKEGKTGAKDNRYHDTVLLLQKYREISWSISMETEQIRGDFQNEYGETIDQFLEDMYCAGAELGGTELEDRTRCIARSRKMLKLLESAISKIRLRSDGELLYQILFLSYLTNESLTTQQIIERLDEMKITFCERTLFRKRKEAVELVASVLWGYSSKECMEILDSFVG